MSDLKVDYDDLEYSHHTLKALQSEFDALKDRADDTGGLWGHDEVRSAMGEFSGNWDYHRRKLSEQIGEVGEKVDSTLETFRTSDENLARSFDKEKK